MVKKKKIYKKKKFRKPKLIYHFRTYIHIYNQLDFQALFLSSNE